MVERERPAARQQERAANIARGVSIPRITTKALIAFGGTHERGNEHRRRQEESIDTGEQAGEQQNGADDLGVRRDVPEEDRDTVALADAGTERGGIGSNPVPAASSTWRQRAAAVDRVIAPLALFVSFYVATLILLAWLRFPYVQWLGLISVSVATVAAVAIWDRFRWPLGLFVPPRLAVPELFLGSAFGVLLIGMCAALVVLSTEVRHEPGAGFPWREVLLVYIPAALHEELLFRGYGFQKLHRWHRGFALVFVAVVFAALHMGNVAVSWLGLLNIFLGGILLGLAYERYGRLWFPIGLHLAWNVMSGPILGHEVSGYDSMATVLVERGSGPDLLTGGNFGIEGSVWMTLTELTAIAFLWRAERISSARSAFPDPAKRSFSE